MKLLARSIFSSIAIITIMIVAAGCTVTRALPTDYTGYWGAVAMGFFIVLVLLGGGVAYLLIKILTQIGSVIERLNILIAILSRK